MENPNLSQHALIEVLYRIEKLKNRYKLAGRPNSELGSFGPRILEIPSEEYFSNTDYNFVSCMTASHRDRECGGYEPNSSEFAKEKLVC